MYKICKLTNQGHRAVNALANALLNNIPADTFQIVEDVSEADCFLVYGALHNPDGNSQTTVNSPVLHENGDPMLLENMDRTLEFLGHISGKPKIVLLDQWYQEEVNRYPEYLTDADIIVNFSGVPPVQPNAFVWVGIESRIYYPMPSVQRLPKSAIISADHAKNEPELFRVVVDAMDAVHVTMDANFEYPSPKVSASWVETQDDMRKLLNQHERVIHLISQHGPEIMGIEGGLCGAKPIYPRNNTYKSIYKGVKGVQLFDLDSPIESLKAILNKPVGAPWRTTEQPAFVEKFAAEQNASAFWNSAKSYFDTQQHPPQGESDGN